MKQKGHIQKTPTHQKITIIKKQQQPSFKTEWLNSLLKPMTAEREKHQHWLFFANSEVFIHLAKFEILGSKANIAMILYINLSTK